MQKLELNNLLKKYLAENCTEQERGILESWYIKYEEKGLPEISQEQKDGQLEEVWAFLSKEIDIPEEAAIVTSTNPSVFLWKVLAAAMVLIIAGIGFYFYPSKENNAVRLSSQQESSEQPNNSNKAMLTLADGRTITLDGAKNGEIANQAGVKITKTKDGQLVYEGKTKETALNKIVTPKGGQYQISLPDGTKVWLNAASSLSYPAAFTGNKREVRLIGEAYFEVTKQKGIPFLVYTKGQEINVLGTHFNVNAYDDEGETKTTLLEGSVRVRLTNSSGTVLLKPGQQAVFGMNQLEVADVDIEEAIAWKAGKFLFQDEDIRSIMRKISRWYDVEVVYSPNVSPNKIGGNISRSQSLSAVLKTLSNTDKFNFKVDGRRVTVMP